jgi:phage shock protein C
MIPETQIKRLYRSRTNYLFAGVAGGIAEYFGIDPTLARVFFFLALLPAGPFGIVIYLILAAIIPVAPADEQVPSPQEQESELVVGPTRMS